MTYIIDGYNVLRRIFAGEFARSSLAEAREFLERKLRAFRQAQGRDCRVLLVFDGQAVAFESPRGEAGFRILFSRAPRTADDVILDLCRDLEGRGEVCVVTSDLRDIGHRVRGLRCRHLTAEEFSDLLEAGTRGAADPEVAERSRTPSSGEVDGWLRDFGLHPDEDEP